MDKAEVARFVDRNKTNSSRADTEKLVKTLSSQVRKAEKAGQDTSDAKAALALAEAALVKLRDGMGDMKNSTKTLTSYHAIPAGN